MTDTGSWNKDKINRQILGVSSVPAASGVMLTSVSLDPGQFANFIVQTIPDSERLSLWNFLFSIVIDDNVTLDTDDQYAFIFPNGANLTSGQQSLTISQWLDWAQSSDRTNKRLHIIRIQNYDTASHTYYLYYKAYTSSNNPGTH